MKILVIKTKTGLKPCYDTDLINYLKIPENEIFEIEYFKKRNPKFHRKYFALLKLCFENQSLYDNLDEMRKDFLIVTNNYDEVINKITGEVYKVPKSIKFSGMDDLEFSKIYEDTKEVIIKLVGISNETIEQEIEQYF